MKNFHRLLLIFIVILVQACSGSDNDDPMSNFRGSATAPNITLVQNEKNQLSLNWDDQVDVVVYSVYLSISNTFDAENTIISVVDTPPVILDTTRASTEYFVKVIANGPTGTITSNVESNQITFISPPLKPGNLTSRVSTSNSIQLTWDDRDGTGSFILYRNVEVELNLVSAIKFENVQSPFVDDFELDSEQTYYYWLVLTENNQTSEFAGPSMIQLMQTTAQESLVAPMIALQRNETDQLILVWENQSNATNYTVSLSSTMDFEPDDTVDTVILASPYLLLDEDSSQRFYLRLLANGALNNGLTTQSEPSNVITFLDRTPLPRNFTAEFAPDNNVITLTWELLDEIESYTIYRSSDQFFVEPDIFRQVIPPFDDTDILSEQDYHYRVVAETADGSRLISTMTFIETPTFSLSKSSPQIISSRDFRVVENVNLVGTIEARNPIDTGLVFRIIDGADADLFSLNNQTGELVFRNSPNYEAPNDSNRDNLYLLEIQVSNGDNFVTQKLRISVSNIDDSPSADAGSDQLVKVGATVTLKGVGGSTTRNVDELRYFWVSPDGIELSSNRIPQPTFTVGKGLRAGEKFNFELIVTDDLGVISKSDFVNIVVMNSGPIARAGESRNARVGEEILLDGSASSDANDDELKYLWTAPPGFVLEKRGISSVAFSIGPNTRSGRVIFTLTVSDGRGMTNTDSVEISVLNSQPEIKSTANTVATVDDAYFYLVSAIDPNLRDTLIYSLGPVPNGMSINSSSGLISWTPTGDQIGSHSVSVSVVDNAQLPLGANQNFVIIVSKKTVEPLNLPPVIISTASKQAKQDEPYQYDLRVNDPNVTDTINYTLLSSPVGMQISSTGTITWTPSGADVGSHLISIQVSDNATPPLDDKQSFTLNVSASVPPNVKPTITSKVEDSAIEATLYQYQVNAIDSDGDPLTYGLDIAPDGMTIERNSGLIRWFPSESQVGVVNTVSVSVFDDGDPPLFATQTFFVTVTELNVAPIIISSAILNAKDRAVYEYSVRANDQNITDGLTYGLNQFPDGMDIDPRTGVIRWVPTSAQIGAHEVGVVVTDNGIPALTSLPQTFSVNVETSNTAPVITSVFVPNALTDEVYTYQVTAADANDGDELTFTLPLKPENMRIEAKTGLINWTPTDVQIGQKNVQVLVTDNGLPKMTDRQVFVITIEAKNVGPRIDSQAIVVANEAIEYRYSVLASDDNPNDTLTYQIVSGPQGLGIDAVTGVITWTPTASQIGKNDIVVSVTDNGQPALSVEQVFSITVAEINVAPIITSAPVTFVGVGTNYVYTLTIDDPNINDTHVIDVMGPEGMQLNRNPDTGTNIIRWTPTLEQIAIGSNSVFITVTDNGIPAGVATQEFSITNDLVAPEIPSNLTATVSGSDRIHLAWAVSLDNGGGVTAGYELYRNGSLVDDLLTDTQFMDNNRIAGEEYRYSVLAYDNSGNKSLASDTIRITIPAVLYSEKFSSASAENDWIIVDETPGNSDWFVNNGRFEQSNERGVLTNRTNRRAALVDNIGTAGGSYHLGSFAFNPALLDMADYQISLDMTPISQTDFDVLDDGYDIGLMFRFVDSDNYYRIAMNSAYGYSRLERRLNGVFTTLGADSRGYSNEGVSIHVDIVLQGNLILVFIDGDARFSVRDTSLPKGGIALYTQDRARFDNIRLTLNESKPLIAIESPHAFAGIKGANIPVSAVALNGDSVEFTLDGSACEIANEVSPGYYVSTCRATSAINHTLDANLLVNGNIVSIDRNLKVGTTADVRVAMGDSLTNGVSDTFNIDNKSIDGKVIAEQGYVAVLQGLLSTSGSSPQIIYNEGVPGDRSDDLQNRVDSILERHPEATIVQLLIGTNDSSTSVETPSGLGCSGSSACRGTFKGNVQGLIDILLSEGITPVIAQAPPAYLDDGTIDTNRNQLISDYNDVIRNELSVDSLGPNLFDYFNNDSSNSVSFYEDTLHFNGLGYAIVGNLWEHAINNGTSLPSRQNLPLVLGSICVRSSSSSCDSPLLVKQDYLQIGSRYYADSTDSLLNMPSSLSGGVWLKTLNADRKNRRDNYLTFNIDRDVDVYIAFDSSATVPLWLNTIDNGGDFIDTGEDLFVTHAISSMRLYKTSIDLVDTSNGDIQFGGNRADGSSGAGANYVVIIQER